MSSGLIILINIALFEVGKIYFQTLFKSQEQYTAILDNVWLISQFAGATGLGFLSDRFWKIPLRKPILIVSTILFYSTIFFLKNFIVTSIPAFIFIVFINGFLGSYLGVARAFFFDQCHEKKIENFVMTVLFQCISWIILGFLLSYDFINFESIGSFLTFSMPLVILALFFTKNEQRETYEAKHGSIEMKKIRKKFLKNFFLLILVSFFIMEFLYQLMPYYGEYFLQKKDLNIEFMTLGIGVGLGVYLSIFLKTLPGIKWIRFIFVLGMILFITFTLNSFFSSNKQSLTNLQFFQYSIVGGIIWALIVQEFMLKSSFNEDGLILGFLESLSTLAEIAGSFLASSLLIRPIIVNNWFFLFLLLTATLLIHTSVKISKKIHKEK